MCFLGGIYVCKGLSPCLPGAEPGRRWLSLRGRCPAGGWLFRLPDLPAVAVIVCPYPPTPRSQSALPGGKGENFYLFRRGFAPGTPALESGAALGKGAFAASAGGLAFPVAGFACRSSAFLPLSPLPPLPLRGRGNSRLFHARGFSLASPGLNPGTNLGITPTQEKFWGVWGTLSRVPQRFLRLFGGINPPFWRCR